MAFMCISSCFTKRKFNTIFVLKFQFPNTTVLNFTHCFYSIVSIVCNAQD